MQMKNHFFLWGGSDEGDEHSDLGITEQDT